MLYKITLNMQTKPIEQKLSFKLIAIVTCWKLVNKFLKEAFRKYSVQILGYKIESINVELA